MYSGLRTESYPPLNRNAFASSWPPFSSATTAPFLPFRRVGDGGALQHADRVAVERRVQHGGAALDLAVVVDRLDALRGGRLLDRRSRAGVDRGDDQDLRAVGDALVGLRLLLLRVALRVDDACGDAGGLEGLDQDGLSNCSQRTEVFVSGISPQTCTMPAFFFDARRRACDDQRGAGEHGDGHEHRRPTRNFLTPTPYG